MGPFGRSNGMIEDTTAWVFAYGSLMWNPGFEYLEEHPALLRGYHRAFCIFSHIYRGSEEKPGLVLGLNRGGACQGRAFRIPHEREAEILTYLDDRELVTGVYVRRGLPVGIPGGRVLAHVYVANPTHPQYARKVAPEKAARIIAERAGPAGTNLEYFENTVNHLETIGIRDHGLLRIREILRTFS